MEGPPKLNLVIEKKPDPYMEKRLKQFVEFQGDRTQELQSKIKLSEDKDPSTVVDMILILLTAIFLQIFTLILTYYLYTKIFKRFQAFYNIIKCIRIDLIFDFSFNVDHCIQIEKFGDGDGNLIKKQYNPKLYYLCDRCENMIPNQQKESHKVAHSSQILPWLYLGSNINADNFKELTLRTNISYILNTANEVTNYFPDKFIYKKVELRDIVEEDISPDIQECVDFICEARKNLKNILVHCVQGISRSATIVLCYLMKEEKMNLKQSWELTHAIRHIIKPNPSFVKALLDYEKLIYGENSIQGNKINEKFSN